MPSRSIVRAGAAGGALLLLAASARSGPALDPELREVLDATRKLLAAGHPGRAAGALEGLSRARPHDPRVWFALGNLRVAQESRRGARSAYGRALHLGTRSMREDIRERMVAAGLEPPEDPLVLEDPIAFRHRAAVRECWALRRTPAGTPPGCPLDGARYLPGPTPRSRPVCPHHPEETRPRNFESEDPWEVSGAVLEEVLRGGEPWARARAVSRVVVEELPGPALRILARETHPRVQEALVERLWCLAGRLSRLPMAKRVLVGLLKAPDPGVRLSSGQLLFLEGTRPTLTPTDFAFLLREADDGRASVLLTVAVFRSQRDALLPALEGVLRDRKLSGKRLGVTLGLLHGGTPGRRLVARAFLENDARALQRHRARAAELLRAVGEEEGVDFGPEPEDWLRALR